MENNKQLGGIDYFKILAALLVIAIHTSMLSSFGGNADFVFTRIIARIAVPFFLMTTGYFLLPRYLFNQSKDIPPLHRFLKRTLLLYAIAVAIYLPVNFYAGHFSNIGFFDVFRMLVFDGTIYHLWYLPASILGVLFIFIMSRKLPFKAILGIAIALYGVGLLGDSYFGFLVNCKLLKEIYDAMFRVFSYTRNGIFYAPIFLVMGAGLKRLPRSISCKAIIGGFVFSVALMIIEGLTLHYLNVQRHDSMYIALLPCMLFLFQLVLSVNMRPSKPLRTISTWIYIIHPLSIILVRGVAKRIHFESLLIDNSLVHYIAVCVLSCTIATILERVLSKRHKQSFHNGRAWIELDKNNLRQNVVALRSLLPQGSKLMPVVKANAYGHGAILVSKELNRLGVTDFCVATILEGADLRRNGVKGEILILGYTHPEQFSLIRKYNLIQTVIDYSYAKVLNSYGKKIRVHIKIDTGMHRLGECSDNLENIYNIFKCENLLIEGAYTHLCADETFSPQEKLFTLEQGKAFYKVISKLKEQGYICHKIHLQASYGLLNYPELPGDYARIGIALYGVLSNCREITNSTIDLYPVLSIKTRIALVKNLYKGENAGYGLQYIANQNKKIAVLTIGYADGLPRSLSGGKGEVLINGCKAPIICICMDQTLADISNISNVAEGDIAIIIGKSGNLEITVYDLAKKTETITNEILSRLGERLERFMV